MKKYRQALVLYERSIFDTRDKAASARLLLKKSHCYKMLGNFSDALTELNRANYSGSGDSVACEVLYQSALCAYLSSQFDEAATRIKMLQYYPKNSVRVHQSLLLETLILAEQMKWDEAQATALAFVHSAGLDPALKEEIIHSLEKHFHTLPKLKKENTGRWMNYLLPGSGQAYAGYPGDGLLSFFLNGSSLAFGVLMIVNGYYLTGYLIGTGLLQKFYFGGLRHTDFLVKMTNYQRVRKFNDELKRIILTEELQP